MLKLVFRSLKPTAVEKRSSLDTLHTSYSSMQVETHRCCDALCVRVRVCVCGALSQQVRGQSRTDELVSACAGLRMWGQPANVGRNFYEFELLWLIAGVARSLQG